jgi:hypothetical protein
MPALIDLTDTAILTAVRNMLLQVVPSGVEVLRAQVNRVAEPNGADFIMMTPLRRERLSTNIDQDQDIIITAGIAGTLMTVTAINVGTLSPGQTLFGPELEPATVILAQIGGMFGGVGAYTVSRTQTVADGTLMYAGLHRMQQGTEITYQLDIHGPASAETAQAVTTVARDSWACSLLAPFGIQPLYANEPRQTPFINAESQYEDRYVVELCVQANPIVGMPQEFADELEIFTVPVENNPMPWPPWLIPKP